MKYEEKGREIGKFVEAKNIKYGDSFAKSGGILRILYPSSIPVDQYDNMLALIRIIDKMFRIAANEGDTEDPWSDIAGYGILKVAQRGVKKEKNENRRNQKTT